MAYTDPIRQWGERWQETYKTCDMWNMQNDTFLCVCVFLLKFFRFLGISATIRTRQEIQCLQCAFFVIMIIMYKSPYTEVPDPLLQRLSYHQWP